jgi:hypothetical protein
LSSLFVTIQYGVWEKFSGGGAEGGKTTLFALKNTKKDNFLLFSLKKIKNVVILGGQSQPGGQEHSGRP